MQNPITRIGSLFSIYRGLPRSIYVLFLSNVVNSIGSFVFPFLTLFLTDRLGYSAEKAGFLIFLAAISLIPGSLIGGKIADRFGRKRVMMISQFLSAAAFVPCAFLGYSPLIPWLIVAADFFMGASRPARQAMVIDLSTPGNRQACFSLLYLGGNLGFSIGPLLAGLLYRSHTPWIFAGDALTTFLALTLVLAFVPETLPSEEAVRESFSYQSEERGEAGSTFSVLLKRPFLLAFVLITVTANFVYFQHTFSLPLHMNEIFTDLGPFYYGIIMTTNGLVVILLTAPVIALTKKITPVRNQVIASLLYAAGFGMVFFIRSFPLFVLSTVIWTIGEVVSVTNTSVYIANHTPVTHRGRFNAILPVIMSAGRSISPPLAGSFISRFSVLFIWPLLFVLSLFSAAAFSLLGMIEHRFRKNPHARLAGKDSGETGAETG